MRARGRYFAGLLWLAVLAVGGIGMLHNGFYGFTIFTVYPVLPGGLASWVFRPATGGRAAAIGAGAALIASCAGGFAVLLLLPSVSPTWDTRAQPPWFEVHSAITIAAPPEQVWKHIVAFPELPEPREWFFRAGIAYPTRTRIEGSGVGATRYCDFSTGPVVEPIEVWDEPRLLRFRVTENPAPMRERSPYGEILPKHLHGYLIAKQGLLEGTTWYRHGLWPAEYWRWWSDAIIHRIHLRVMNHIRALAEAEPAHGNY